MNRTNPYADLQDECVTISDLQPNEPRKKMRGKREIVKKKSDWSRIGTQMANLKAQ